MPLVKGSPQSSLLKSLLADIKGKDPIGVFSEEDELYIAVEDEMINLGGLQSVHIDWDVVEKHAITYLSDRCKNLRVVGHLIQCWLLKSEIDFWTDSCILLHKFCEKYFETSHPRPGKRGLANKIKLTEMLVDRIKNNLDAVLEKSPTEKELDRACAALKALLKTAEWHEWATALDAINLMLHKVTSDEVGAKKTTSKKGAKSASAPNTSGAPRSLEKTMTAVGERELRRTLLASADEMNKTDAGDPSGYALRRYALWGYIHSAPVAAADERTELRSVLAETEDDYLESIQNAQASLDLLERIERSVTSSVYWFKGSYLAAQAAQKLKMSGVSYLIWSAVTRFLEKVPALQKLKFNDGRPFIDELTAQWLLQKHAVGSSAASSSDYQTTDYTKLQGELTQLMDSKGVEAVLLQLDALQTQKSSPRERCQIMKVTADLMAMRGLTWLSQKLYQQIKVVMEESKASDWEAEFHQQVLSKLLDEKTNKWF